MNYIIRFQRRGKHGFRYAFFFIEADGVVEAALAATEIPKMPWQIDKIEEVDPSETVDSAMRKMKIMTF